MIPDTPVLTPDQDELGRLPFASAVADLILGAPAKSSIRIGIHGGWGEGKTSVLKLIECQLRAEGHHAVWLSPWASSSREDLLAALFSRLAVEVGLKSKKVRFVKRLAGFTAGIREASKSDLRAGIADALVGTWVEGYISRSVEETTVRFLADVTAALKGKKLVVLVDDVDRIRPDIVPQILLTLREVLDHPDFFYVMALAPQIVEAGLSQVHQGWGTPKQFLEKIIELPLHLPAPTDDQWKAFVAKQVHKLPVSPPWNWEVAQYLPSNPRKAKLFFRFVGSLQRLLSRFEEEEMDWRSLSLCLMLVLEYPEQARSLAADKEALSDLAYGAIADLGDTSSKKRPNSEAYEKHAPATDADRFRELCRAIRERELFTRGAYSLKQMLTMHESPPVLTWKELSALHEEIRETGISAVTRWLAESPEDVRRPRATAFFSLIREWRNGVLDKAAEEDLQRDLEGRLAESTEGLAVLRDYIRAELPFAADEWLQLYGQAADWAHFNRMGYYTQVRAAERALLSESISYLDVDAQVQVLSRHTLRHDSMANRRPVEFVTFSDSLRAQLESTVVSAAIRMFEEKDGVKQFWGEKGNSPLKDVVFGPDSAFHAPGDAQMQIRTLANRAMEGDKAIQENFRTYFRMLTYAAFEHGGSFSATGALRILGNAEFVSLVWSAAVVTPLYPRIMGSLRDDRIKVIRSGIPEASLPLPTWWMEVQEEFNAITSGTPVRKDSDSTA